MKIDGHLDKVPVGCCVTLAHYLNWRSHACKSISDPSQTCCKMGLATQLARYGAPDSATTAAPGHSRHINGLK